MKKSIFNIFAGLTAAALLMTVGCKAQDDYVNDTTALNKMNILGFTVTGLDQSYDQATAKLVVIEGQDEDGNDVETVIGSTTVAAYTATEGYKSGTAYVKFDESYLYDGDKFKTSKLNCFLVVGDDVELVFKHVDCPKRTHPGLIPLHGGQIIGAGLLQEFIYFLHDKTSDFYNYLNSISIPQRRVFVYAFYRDPRLTRSRYAAAESAATLPSPADLIY